jgi:hypothetical protein
MTAMKSITLALAVLGLSLPAACAELTGLVADPKGAGIGGAFVLIHWDPAGSSVGLKTNQGIGADLRIVADHSGHFRAEVPPGFYDILATSSAFSPSCAKVRLRNGKTTTNQRFTLKADPLVTAELGDTFNVPGKK